MQNHLSPLKFLWKSLGISLSSRIFLKLSKIFPETFKIGSTLCENQLYVFCSWFSKMLLNIKTCTGRLSYIPSNEKFGECSEKIGAESLVISIRVWLNFRDISWHFVTFSLSQSTGNFELGPKFSKNRKVLSISYLEHPGSFPNSQGRQRTVYFRMAWWIRSKSAQIHSSILIFAISRTQPPQTFR